MKTRATRKRFAIEDNDILTKWQGIGAEHGLTTDTQIASFLIQKYDKSPTCCVRCQNPLTLFCTVCWLPGLQTPDLQPPPTTSTLFLSSSGNGDKNIESPIKKSVLSAVDTEFQDIKVQNTGDSGYESALAIAFEDLQNNDADDSEEHSGGGPQKQSVVTGEKSTASQTEAAEVAHVFENLFGETLSVSALCDTMANSSQPRTAAIVGTEIPDPLPSVTKPQRRTRVGRKKNTSHSRLTQGSLNSISTRGHFGISQSDPQSIWSSESKPKYKITCTVCDKEFPNWRAVRQHKLTEHPGDRPYKCSQCCSAFKKHAKLQYHLITHTQDKPFLCTVCGKGFQHKENLSIHSRTHTLDRPYVCKLCGSAFTQNSNLYIHIKQVHTDDRPYVCEICSKSFVVLGDLKRHKVCHSNLRPFPCQLCLSAFKCKRGLRKHVNEVHNARNPDQKVHHCTLCEFTTHVPVRLRTHMLSHSDERPFKCGTCSKSFRRSHHLDNHLITHKGKTAFVCSICSATYNRKDNLQAHMKKRHGE